MISCSSQRSWPALTVNSIGYINPWDLMFILTVFIIIPEQSNFGITLLSFAKKFKKGIPEILTAISFTVCFCNKSEKSTRWSFKVSWQIWSCFSCGCDTQTSMWCKCNSISSTHYNMVLMILLQDNCIRWLWKP